MAKYAKPLLFTLALIPVAVVAGFFVTLYQIDGYSEEMIAEVVAQLGSIEVLLAVGVVQTVIYAAFCGFFGYILADKTGLWKPFRLSKKNLTVTLILSSIGGVAFALDYWTFGNVIDGVKEGIELLLTKNGIIGSILYGGFVEEVMLRLFFMSLIAFAIWKLFLEDRYKYSIPTAVLVIANIVAALAFAAGHLPATMVTFGELTPIILIRCFLYNGGLGLLFGWLYRKYGIAYAMMGHALCHIVSKVVWFIFI